MTDTTLLNLVRNSATALATTPPEKRVIEVDVRATPDRQVALTVRDHGIGISDEVAASMFRPFFTTGSDGLGLGLAISRSIIEAHGGRIWAEYTREAGTKLCFLLPAERIADRERGPSKR